MIHIFVVIPHVCFLITRHDSELDILGVDGHIYKGRINKQDPARRYPLAAYHAVRTFRLKCISIDVGLHVKDICVFGPLSSLQLTEGRCI